MKNIWPQTNLFFPFSSHSAKSFQRKCQDRSFLPSYTELPLSSVMTYKKKKKKKKKSTKAPYFWSLVNLWNLSLLFRLLSEPHPSSTCNLQDTTKSFRGSKDPLCSPRLISCSLTPLPAGLFSPFSFIFRYHRSKLPSIIPLPFISKFNELSLLSSSFAGRAQRT